MKIAWAENVLALAGLPMLVRVKPSRSDNMRHRSGWLKADTESRLTMRAGMAKTALRAKYTGMKEVDCNGRPLKYANEMAGGHSMATLEKWAKRHRTAYSTPDSAYAKGWELAFGKGKKES